MVLKTFTIRDSKGEFYSPPFFQKTQGKAIVTWKHRDWETVPQSQYRDWETLRDWGTAS